MWRRSRYVTPQQPRAKPYLWRVGDGPEGEGQRRQERTKGRNVDMEKNGDDVV
jgi:hypothetical protein